jgi:hypothetical protein
MAHDSGSVVITAVSGGIKHTGYGSDTGETWSAANLSTSANATINGTTNEWYKNVTHGPITFGTGQGELYNNFMQIGDGGAQRDYTWLVGKDIVAYDHTKVYSVEARIKQLEGTGSIYVGVSGWSSTSVKENATGANNFSSQHYFGASNYKPTGSEWFTTKGYFSGHASSGNGGYHRDIDDPGTVHDDATYISPLVIVNYVNEPGIVLVDYVEVKEVKDAAGTLATGSIVAAKTMSLAKSRAGATGSDGAPGDPGATGPTGPTFDFLTGSLDSVNTTGGIAAGLLQTSQVFGYHKPIAAGDGTNALLSDFTSYLDAGGNFYLGGNDSGISASGDFGYFAWNNSDRSLLISGSAVNIEVDQFYLGRTDQYVSGSGGNIEIKSSTFHLERDGDLNMQGNVTASGIMINGDAKIQGGVTASGIMIDGSSTFKGTVEIENGSVVPGSSIYQHGPLTFHPRSYGDVNDSLLPNATFGDKTDNAIEYVVGPMGGQELAIVAYPDEDFNNDGGFDSNKIPIDPTSAYMFTVYIKRKTNAAHGKAYFGTHGYDASGTNGYIITNTSTSYPAVNTNPYFFHGDLAPHGETVADSLDRWFLHIGYVYPSGSPVDLTRKGAVYDLTTGLTGSYDGANGDSFMWHTGAAQADIRAYHFYNTNGNGSTVYQEFARPGLFKMDGSEPTIQSLLSNVSTGGSTTINGAAITTGMIQSANVTDTVGSRINLSDGTIQMGGTGSNAGFVVDSDGFVTATNFREKLVTVTATNKTEYFSDNGTDGVNLLFDGSGGGEVTMNMKLNVAPQLANGTEKPIQDIVLPAQLAGFRIGVSILINVANVQFDDGEISGTIGSLDLSAGD